MHSRETKVTRKNFNFLAYHAIVRGDEFEFPRRARDRVLSEMTAATRDSELGDEDAIDGRITEIQPDRRRNSVVAAFPTDALISRKGFPRVLIMG